TNLRIWMVVCVTWSMLVGRLCGICRMQVDWHLASVKQVVRWNVRFDCHLEVAPHSTSHAGTPCRNLLLGLAVNSGIHLGELEEVFAVVACFGVVVSGRRQAEIRFPPKPFRS